MIVLVIILILATLYLLSTACRTDHPQLQAFRGHAFAHRGLHGEGAPENSMEAFRRAKECGYGVELDVHLLADGNLAVIHDSLLVRTTGAEGCVEDLTALQLKELRLEGTKEFVPEFSDVLTLFDGKVPLIVELKPKGNNHAQLTEKACDALEKYEGVYCLESFDPKCIWWLKKNRPNLVRGQLIMNYLHSEKLKLPWVARLFVTGLAFNFLILPDFVAVRYSDRKTIGSLLSRKLWGAMGVTWTLTEKEEYDVAISEDLIPIFEGFKP
mgnify:CR=1 FL=1